MFLEHLEGIIRKGYSFLREIVWVKRMQGVCLFDDKNMGKVCFMRWNGSMEDVEGLK